MTTRRGWAAARHRLARGSAGLGALALVALPCAAASADPPQRLDTQLVDAAGAVDDPAAVEAALQRLEDEDGVQLFVVLVDSFDGQDSFAWADETASMSSLGVDDPLLAIAVDDRAYAVSVDPAFTLSDDDLADLEDDDLVPRLAEDDWGGAVVAYADGMRSEVGGSGGGVPVGAGVAVVGGLVAVGGGLVAVGAARRRRGKPAEGAVPPGGTPPPDETLEALGMRANRALVATDEAVRTSDRELGFAQAEFGDAATQPFTEALGRARQAVVEGFSLRQRLDDAEPESDADRRTMLERIVWLCGQADADLDAQTESFTRLRDLGTRLPELVPALQQRLAAAEASVPAAAETVADLSRRFSPGAVEQVVTAPDEARRRLDVARERLAAAAGTGGEAAVAFRTAEEAVAQAEQLVAGVARTQDEVMAAGNALPRAISALHADVTAHLSTPTPAGVAVPVATAEALTAGQAALAYAEQSGRVDPVGALAKVSSADAALDAATAAVRDAGERLEKARATLPQAIGAAQAQIAAAEDFIATHRGAVGGTARTRATEAARVLAEAQAGASVDAVAALAGVQRAAELASSAGDAARADVAATARSTAPWPDDRTGAVSGGGVLDVLFGGGGGNRGWGGSGGWSSGSSWGGGGGGWSSGSSGRSSSRRSSGGSVRRSSTRSSGSRSGGRRGGRGRF